MIRRHMLLWGDSDSSDSSDEENNQRLSSSLRRALRDKSDPFNLPELEFRKMYRLSRSVAKNLLEQLIENDPTLTNKTARAIPFGLRFLGALNFFAQGSYQRSTGDNRIHCQSQSSLSRSIKVVSDAMYHISRRYVKLPEGPDDIMASKVEFLMSFGMPGIVCAIDGTHVAIATPAKSENGFLYYNRKHFHSVNVLAACNAKQLFVYANANYPGSVHDSAIWQMSGLRDDMPDDSYILGDSGFPSEPCLLTPVANAEPGSKAERYNRAHKRARNVVERSFGMLKMRFRCLTRHRALHYTPKRAARIIYACIVLHNICVLSNLDDTYDDVEILEDDNSDVHDGTQANNEGRRVRDQYIDRYF